MQHLPSPRRIALVASFVAANAMAQSTPSVSDTYEALPGIHRIGVPGEPAPRYSAAASLGYGFTPPPGANDNASNTVGGMAAIGFAPASFLSMSARFDYQKHFHGRDAEGIDQSSSIDVTPTLRTGYAPAEAWRLGAQISVPFYGAAAVDSFPSPVIDARAQFAHLGFQDWVVAANLGYKSATHGPVIENSDNLRTGDRITLGLSEFDGLLVGIGALRRLGNTELFAEANANILLGSEAPPVAESPWIFALGARHHLSAGFSLQAVLETSPLPPPPAAPGDSLAPVMPLVSGLIGVVYRLPEAKKPDVEPPVQTKPAPEAPPPPPQPAPTAALQVVVVDNTGHPISDARVTLEYPPTGEANGSEEKQEVRELPLTRTNLYEQTELPLGDVILKVSADLLETVSLPVKLEAGDAGVVNIELKPAALKTARLRGLVRAYTGEGLAAKISVSPAGLSATCGEDGEFELELPPGEYEVTIGAEGYQAQKRTLRVRAEGVTVLNADLQKQP